MKRLKLTFFLLLALPLAMVSHAAVVEETAASNIAARFVSSLTATGRFNATVPVMQLEHTEYSTLDNSTPAYYVFNVSDDGGWVIVAGDDRAASVLGYNGSGSFEWDDIPCGLKALLDSYRHEMEYLQQHPEIERPASTLKTSLQASATVGPLLTTKWDQRAPYYNKCPLVNSSHCLTGCVATAMAQVMYYYKHPTDKCLPIPEYTNPSNDSLIASLAARKFTWAKMLDEYKTDSYTTAQGNAVAWLMRYCGQAVEMQYGLGGSGALFETEEFAHYFKYNKDSIRQIRRMTEKSHRDSITGKWVRDTIIMPVNEWNEIAKHELDQSRPIWYTAWVPAGYHAFVLDGYEFNSDTIYFHANFGWSGALDGYYQIVSGDFIESDWPSMVIGITPKTDVSGDSLTCLSERNNWFPIKAPYQVRADGLYPMSYPTTMVLSIQDNTSDEYYAKYTQELIADSTSMTFTCDATLPEGYYCFKLYYMDSDSQLQPVTNCSQLDFIVIGNVGIIGTPSITTVTSMIDELLDGNTAIDISDITTVIDYLLGGYVMSDDDGLKADTGNEVIDNLINNMVLVQGGTYTMGATPEQESTRDNETPTHEVTVSTFYIGKYEVTQAEWEAVMGSNPTPARYQGDKHPIVSVSWNECKAFIDSLNKITGYQFRLPSEEEWEFAARGGNNTKGYKYAGSDVVGAVAWYSENSNQEIMIAGSSDDENEISKALLHNVGERAANELGLYDMSGNVWEWCSDTYLNYVAPLKATGGTTLKDVCVIRGGSGTSAADCCRTAYRNSQERTASSAWTGFRLALKPSK